MRALVPVVAISVFLLVGCARPAPVAVTRDMSDAVKIAVLSTLRDPSSAQFGDTFSAVKRYDHIRVCGVVNARNGFGGYVGQQVFAAIYYPETGKAFVESMLGGDPGFSCALSGASGYSTSPPAAVLAQQGIAPAAPLTVPSDYNLKKSKQAQP